MRGVESVRSEQSRIRAKAVELLRGRCLVECVGELWGSGVAGSPLSALGASGVGRYGFLGLEWGV